jgi:hypothetical protein
LEGGRIRLMDGQRDDWERERERERRMDSRREVG